MAVVREPGKWRTRGPSDSLSIGTFIARKLRLRDGSVHDGFRVLTQILGVWSPVLCIQEVQAVEFPSLPVDQPYHYDGPVGTRVREAAFLVRSGVSGASVSGVEDTTSVRWRVFHRSWCSCSFYDHMLGFSLTSELLSGVSSSTGPVTSTDLCVCPWSSPLMRLLFVNQLISSCNLELCNPREQVTHISGRGLGGLYVSGSCAVSITVHSGNQCCMEAPACCPPKESNHFLCIAHSIPLSVSPARCEHKPLLPLSELEARPSLCAPGGCHDLEATPQRD